MQFYSYSASKLTRAEKVPTYYFSFSTRKKNANQNIFFGDHFSALQQTTTPAYTLHGLHILMMYNHQQNTVIYVNFPYIQCSFF